MNFSTQWGPPQAVLLGIAGFGLVLAIWALFNPKSGKEVDVLEDKRGHRYHQYRHYRRFRWPGTLGGVAMLLVALLLLWIAGAMQEYLGLTGKIMVAHVRAVQAKSAPGSAPMMSVELTLYDQNGHAGSPQTYIVNGDEVFIGGDIIAFKSWMNILGFHSGYKLTKLEGMYSDVNLEEHAQHTVIVLNGGDDNFFNSAYHQGLTSLFVTAAYKNGSSVPTNGIGYNICVSQDAIVPQPDKEPC
jgi:hypothetical protein